MRGKTGGADRSDEAGAGATEGGAEKIINATQSSKENTKATESIIFGFVWAFWHLPLFWINGTYHAGLRALGPVYVLNFLISVVPMGFLMTWVYVKNNRSMLACILFHLFVNTMQEKIAMTPQTKCVETIVVTLAAVLVVMTNREMFFEAEHIGNLLNYNEKRKVND